MEWSEGGGKWDNCNSIINKYIKNIFLKFSLRAQHVSWQVNEIVSETVTIIQAQMYKSTF